MEVQSKKNLFCYCILIVLVIAVHYVVVLNPDISMQSGQKAIFSWPAIGIFGSLVVCHCYRTVESKICIISARKATKKEQGIYFRRS
jgi:uncharacterized DUF497 family protein